MKKIRVNFLIEQPLYEWYKEVCRKGNTSMTDGIKTFLTLLYKLCEPYSEREKRI